MRAGEQGGRGGGGQGRGGGGQRGFSQVAGPSRGAGQTGRGERAAEGGAGDCAAAALGGEGARGGEAGGRGGHQEAGIGRGRGAGGRQTGGGGTAGVGRGRGGHQDVGRGRGGRQAGGGGGRGRGVRARNWAFTINNYVDFPKELPRGPPPVTYLCFGKEVSQNGTPHLQGFVSFKNAVYRPSRFFEQYGQGHFEMARGTAEQNAEYCAKDGDFTEYGRRPESRADQGCHGARGGRHGGQGGQHGWQGGDMEIERWEDAWRCAKEGKVEEIPADIRLRHYTTITKVAAKYQKPPPNLARLDNTWIVGPPGTGKSTYVHQKYPGAYKKGFTRWWCGYRDDDEGHQTVLLDDLHPRWSEKELLKNWADLFAFVAETKGGSMLIRPARIVVTSNYTIEQVPLVLFLQIGDDILMKTAKNTNDDDYCVDD